MSYQKLLIEVAKEHSTTPEEIEKEMAKAINAAGLDIEPSLFIAIVSSKLKKDYMS